MARLANGHDRSHWRCSSMSSDSMAKEKESLTDSKVNSESYSAAWSQNKQSRSDSFVQQTFVGRLLYAGPPHRACSHSFWGGRAITPKFQGIWQPTWVTELGACSWTCLMKSNSAVFLSYLRTRTTAGGVRRRKGETTTVCASPCINDNTDIWIAACPATTDIPVTSNQNNRS